MGFGSYKTVTVDGVDYPIAFNMRVLMEFQAEQGADEIDVEQLMRDMNMLEKFVWLGFREGHNLAGQEMTIAKGHAISVDVEAFTNIVNLISASLSGPVSKESKNQQINNGKKHKTTTGAN